MGSATDAILEANLCSPVVPDVALLLPVIWAVPGRLSVGVRVTKVEEQAM